METPDEIVGQAIERLQAASSKIKNGEYTWAAYDLGTVQARIYVLMEMINTRYRGS